MQAPRVLVCQHGARRRYAIPQVLEEAGMLAALFTDSSVHSTLGRLARALGQRAPAQVRRLARREIRGVPEAKIFSSDVLAWKSKLRSVVGKEYSEYDRWCRVLSKQMISWVEGGVAFDVVYNMFCENLDFVRYAKRERGARVVSDIYIHPYAEIIVAEEAMRIGIDRVAPPGIQNVGIEAIREICEISDVLICPSQFVADGVVAINGDFARKVEICPYGSSIQYNEKHRLPVRGRVFWAGGDWMRKGLHILASAADQLLRVYPDMEFRAAGMLQADLVGEPMFKNINFIGKLNKEEMQREYLSADCFALPSLAEGMAGAALEALAAGCPVIVTKAAGIDGIIDGENGFVVGMGSVVDLYSRIESLYLDRCLRDSISQSALALAEFYRLDAWKDRLVRMLRAIA